MSMAAGMKHVLTIAGSDSSGGAGIQADLKAMCALGAYGMSAITAVTAQNTRGVQAVFEVDPAIVAAQVDAVFSDIRVDAIKVGMLSSAAIARTVSERLVFHRAANIVVDPVMVSTSGHSLLSPDAAQAVMALASIADLVTPNIPEAERMTGMRIRGPKEMELAARALCGCGIRAVLIKGGHLKGDAVDLLYADGDALWISAPRVHTRNTHGTGCTLSAAIACHMAQGLPIAEAVRRAKDYVGQAIRDALDIGSGAGPVGHMAGLYRAAGAMASDEEEWT